MAAEMPNIFGDFRRVLLSALDALTVEGALPKGLDVSRVAVELPRDPSHGDLATNAAMVLAGQAEKKSMALAETNAPRVEGGGGARGGHPRRGVFVQAGKTRFLEHLPH